MSGHQAQPADYSLPGVMRYLQTEWQRNERDRIQWELERAEMKTRIAKLEGEKRGLQLLVENHVKRIKALEATMDSDLLEASKQEFDKQIEETKDVDLSPLVESRQYLERCIQEVEYLLQTNTISDEQQHEQAFPQPPVHESNGSHPGIMSRDVHPSKIKHKQQVEDDDSEKKWKWTHTINTPNVNSVKLYNNKLITAGDEGLRVWNAENGTYSHTISNDSFWKLDMAPNEATVYTRSKTQTVGYDIDSGKRTFECEYAADFAAGPGTDLLATTSDTMGIKLWHVSSQSNLSTIDLNSPYKVKFLGKEKLMVATSGNKLALVDIETGKTIVDFESKPQPVSDMCFTATGDVIVAAHDDGSIYQYDLKSGATISQVNHGSKPIGCLVASPQGRQFASVSPSQNGVKIWTAGSEPKFVEYLIHQDAVGCDWQNQLVSCGNNVVQTYIK